MLDREEKKKMLDTDLSELERVGKTSFPSGTPPSPSYDTSVLKDVEKKIEESLPAAMAALKGMGHLPFIERVPCAVSELEAKIDPLPLGKYYGSQVSFLDKGYEVTSVRVWYMGNRQPSTRQIEQWGHTQEQWDKNSDVPTGFGDTLPAQEVMREAMCDSHYETADGYAICEKIAKAINGKSV